MNTKLKMLLTAIAAPMLSSGAVYGQTVVVEGNRVFIDASGIAHTTTPKARTTTATNTTVCTQNATDIASLASDVRVYKKFEVQAADIPTVTGTKPGTDWLNAVNLCAALPLVDGKGWRLPTQRELMLMMVLHSQLKKVPIFTPLVNIYWSATENSANPIECWYTSFYANGTYSSVKTYLPFNVRCIREVI